MPDCTRLESLTFYWLGSLFPDTDIYFANRSFSIDEPGSTFSSRTI